MLPARVGQGEVAHACCAGSRASALNGISVPQSGPGIRAPRLEASAEGVDRLADEAHRRGVEGVKRPVFHGGKKVGEITEYSEFLIKNLLRCRRPEVYGLRHDSTTRVNA